MTDISPRTDAPKRPADRPARPRRRGGPALVAIALAAAVTSAALLVHSHTPEAASRAVTHSAPVMDVTEAAAYAATSANTIEIKSYAFAPAAATVPVGTTVTWVNEDSVPHTVTSKAGPASFDSGQLGSGASWSATFATPGVYDYYCIDHPQMVARITVTAAGGGGTPPPPPSSTATTKPPTSAPPSGTSTTKPATSPPPSSAPSTKPSTSVPPSTPHGSSPAGSSSSSMSMPPSSGGSGAQCGAVNQALNLLIQHIDTTHLGESPGQQVQDLTNLNQYVLSHTTLVANMLTPLLNGATTATDSALSQLIAHINATHLGESPGQQVQDLLNLDQYVLSHTTLVANMLVPAEGVLVGC